MHTVCIVALDEYFSKVEAMASGVSAPPAVPTPVAVVSSTIAAPILPTSATATPSCSAPVGLSAHAVFEKLEKLIAWRSSGHLSDADFIAAKRALGLG